MSISEKLAIRERYIVKDFVRYQLYYLSGGSSQAGSTHEAEIDCFTETNERAGILYFLPDGSTLPRNVHTVNGIYLYYPSRRFADVIAILREEKPLSLWLDTRTNVGYVSTAFEPVGEQEAGA